MKQRTGKRLWFRRTTWIVLLIFFQHCQTATNVENTNTSRDSAQKLVNKSIAFHGLGKLDSIYLSFDFRNYHYTVSRDHGAFAYTRQMHIDTLGLLVDRYTNTRFERTIDGTLQNTDTTWQNRYRNSINSVVYFALLPYFLNDPAAQKKYLGIDTVGGNIVEVVEVTFRKTGGGKDYEDVFHYFFNSSTHALDYLAYTYETEGGGIRFRQAINRREIGGIVWQDYINFAPEEETMSLYEIADAFDQKQLDTLSRIELKNIHVGTN